jgi:DNA-binding SARP family transcriptional activator
MGPSITTFGEFALVRGDSRIDLGGSKQRRLLALLIVRANRPVRVGELIDALWDGTPPRSARKNLQVHASKLRRAVDREVSYIQGGYRLDLEPEACDLLLFEQYAAQGARADRAGDTRTAADQLGHAVELWTGRPLAEFDDVPAISEAVDEFQDSYWPVLERWAELQLEHGRPGAVLDRLQAYAGRELLRERLAAAWMAALAASGRTNDALAHFASVRRALATELGLSPGPVLARLHARLLEPAATPARRNGPGNQLPRGLPDFVGRTSHVNHAVGRLSAGAREVLVVCGPVGIGKSAFAVHVAHLVADSFPDGAILVDVGGREIEAVLRTLLDDVGLRRGDSVRHDRARWRAWLAERRMLLVLDDAVDEDVVNALLPGSGGSCTIVTSRYRLSGIEGATRLGLLPLTEAEGMDLLGRVVGFGRVVADSHAAHRIIALCEYLPLAIRATGARLDSLRHFRLPDYADRLARQSPLIDEMRSGGLVLADRYRTFWRDLPAASGSAFRDLLDLIPPGAAQGPGPISLSPIDLPAETLERLLDCSLLAAPDAEVSTHVLVYGISRFAYESARCASEG